MRQFVAVVVVVVCILAELDARHHDHHSPHNHHHHHKKRGRKHHDHGHHGEHDGHHDDNGVQTASDSEALKIHTVKIGWLNVPKVVGCRCRHKGAICIKGPEGKPTCVQKHHLRESARLFKHYHEMKEQAEEDLNEVDPPPHTPQPSVQDTPQETPQHLAQEAAVHTHQTREISNFVLHPEEGCDSATLEDLRHRLISWFHLLHSRARAHHRAKHHRANRHRSQRHQSVKKELREPGRGQCQCLGSALWQFGQLDVDGSLSLSEAELSPMVDSEACVLPYLHSCDADHDKSITSHEWCCCFHHTEGESPCYARLEELEPTKNTASYLPSCDSEGFYRAEQCRGDSSGQTCWCVLQNGDEIPATRKKGRAHCSKLNKDKDARDQA